MDQRSLISVVGALLIASVLGTFLLAPFGESFSRRLLPQRLVPVARASLGGFFLLLLLHALFIVVASRDPHLFYTVNEYWPLRVVAPRPGLVEWPDALFLVLGGALLLVVVRIAIRDQPVQAILLLALSLALIVLLNSGQGGPYRGLAGSVSNPPFYDQMYDDAVNLPSVKTLLERYDTVESIEGWRSPHTKTHPPLPLLLLAAARKNEISVGWIALVQVLISAFAPLLALRLYQLLRFSSQLVPSRLALLLAVTPAINIYSGTSLEAVVLTACLVLALVFVWASKTRSAWMMVFGGGLFVFVALLSFGSVWMLVGLPFLGALAVPGYFRERRARVRDAILFLSPVLICYVGLYGGFGYNYVANILVLSRSGMGVSWLSSWVVVLESRLQNVFELAIMSSPFLLGLWIKGVRQPWRDALPANDRRLWIVGFPIAALLLFTPIYSEFARGWLFLFPFLLLPLGAFLTDAREVRTIFVVTAVWLFLLQSCFGFSW